MTDPFVLVIALLCVGVYGLFVLLDVLGNDTDLDSPWTPGDRPWWHW